MRSARTGVAVLFNSLEFFFFLPVVLGLYYALRHRAQNRALLAASYVFYGWWDVRFLFLIVASTAIDYLCGLMIGRGQLQRRQGWLPFAWVLAAAIGCVALQWQGIRFVEAFPYVAADDFWNFTWKGWGLPLATAVLGLVALGVCHAAARVPEATRKKLFLIVSIAANLGILAVFKYCNFFLENVETAVRSLGGNVEALRLDIVLPVGISFYTFQTMSYTIDIYRGTLKPTDRFLDFALFVAFFPQLVAGPIERASNLLPRILAPRRLHFDAMTRGVFLITFGLFKKVAIADGLARYVDGVYGASAGVSGADVALATMLFAFQIYCDFSGYSDIARGVAKLMGIDLIRNFNLPYFSRSPSEFWQRWHISLSGWLRDYLYIPLGGNRGGGLLTYRNLLLTMVLGGLWHGAAWNFVLWGLYQGGLLCAFRGLASLAPESNLAARHLTAKYVTARPQPATLVFLLQVASFFALTCYGWLLFRATSFEQIVQYTTLLFTDTVPWMLTARPSLHTLAALALLIGTEIIEYRAGTVRFVQNVPIPIRGFAYASILFLITIGLCNEPTQFIYFQF